MSTTELKCPTCGKAAYEITTSGDTERKFSCVADPAHDWTEGAATEEEPAPETALFNLDTVLGTSAFLFYLQTGSFEDSDKVWLDIGPHTYTIAIEDIRDRVSRE